MPEQFLELFLDQNIANQINMTRNLVNLTSVCLNTTEFWLNSPDNMRNSNLMSEYDRAFFFGVKVENKTLLVVAKIV
jgi:hypothetical protein